MKSIEYLLKAYGMAKESKWEHKVQNLFCKILLENILVFKNWFMLSGRILSYGCMQKKGNRRLVSSVGRAPVCCAGGRGFEPQTGPTLRVLK